LHELRELEPGFRFGKLFAANDDQCLQVSEALEERFEVDGGTQGEFADLWGVLAEDVGRWANVSAVEYLELFPEARGEDLMPLA